MVYANMLILLPDTILLSIFCFFESKLFTAAKCTKYGKRTYLNQYHKLSAYIGLDWHRGVKFTDMQTRG